MRVVACGPDALLAEVDSTREALDLYATLRAETDAGRLHVADLVPAARTVLVDGVADVEAARSLLAAWVPPDAPAPSRGSLGLGEAGASQDVVEVPTRYDGADLAEVAGAWGMSVEEAVATHTGTEHVVAFCGFAPGFAYCTGLPAELHLPRLPTPRSRVPAGSVAVAGEFCGVYPRASPGGWRLLGRTDLVLWDATRPRPATLAPGTRVRFVAVSG